MKKILTTLFLSSLFITSYAQWIDGGPKITTTQNVGIGTSSPGFKLDVVGISRFQNVVMANNSRITTNVNDYFLYQDKVIGHYALDWGYDKWNPAEFTLRMSSFGGMKFFTKGSYRLGITKEGNVGIGTDNPLCKLDVDGDIRARSLYLGLEKVINNWNCSYIYYPGNSLVFKPNIGSNMNSEFEFISGTSENGPITTNLSLQMSPKNGKYEKKVLLHTNGNSYFNGGNVGIGTENPQFKFEVNGDIKSNNIILPLQGKLSISLDDNFTYQDKAIGHYSFGWVSDSWNTGGPTLWQSAYAGIKFFTAGRYRMGINTNGNVGIGTENPQNKLDVNGTIRATEVKVETGWADFVFDKDYKLPTLQEVENHINEHKHLPDIPSEAEVKENGVSLGEMQAKLLQKIEELTLYTIELNKTVKEQGELIQELKSKLE